MNPWFWINFIKILHKKVSHKSLRIHREQVPVPIIGGEEFFGWVELGAPDELPEGLDERVVEPAGVYVGDAVDAYTHHHA